MKHSHAMRTSRFIIITLAVLAGLFIASCEKETETLSLTGYPVFDLPSYGVVGQEFHLEASGVTDEDGNEVQYHWLVSPLSSERDTSVTFDLTLPDTLMTITVICTAFAEGYYTSGTSRTISIISDDKTNGSLTGLSFEEAKDFLYKDERDGREYWCRTIGNKDWFKENLAYLGYGRPMDNCTATAGVFGVYYTWNEAVDACPEGWRVSSLQDWAELASQAAGKTLGPKDNYYDIAGDFMGNVMFNSEDMWEYWPKVKITDKFGLSVAPMGYVQLTSTGIRFKEMYSYATVLMADEKDSEKGYYRYIFVEKPDFMLGNADKDSFAAPVRCVRDRE